MIRNYLRIAYRSLLKNKAFSFINIVGLAVGLAAFLFIVHYVRFEHSYEGYNKNAENIFRMTLDLYNGSEYVVTDCETYAMTGPGLKEKMPEVVDYARMFHNDGLQEIKTGDRKFLDEGIYFADPSAFDMFAVRLLTGDTTTALTAPMLAVISESNALKYFGRTDVVGEPLEIDRMLYHVSGVMADVPPNTHLKFNILLSHTSVMKRHPWYKDDTWENNNEFTYLKMKPGTDVDAFNKKLVAFSETMKDKINKDRLAAEPMRDIHLYSHKTFEPEVNGNARTVSFLMLIAVFIIIIAWVNYINLSTARAMERAREVGIRKVMGSLKSQLIFQFLSEAVLVNGLASLLALALFQTALPLFRQLTGQPLSMHVLDDTTFWMLWSALLLAGSILSGLYPAFVLSSFNPATVLKGKFRSSTHGQRLRQALVVFQFAATVILLACMCTVYLQITYLRKYDLGMSIDQTLIVRAPDLELSDSLYRSAAQSLKTELLRRPVVQGVAQTTSLPGLSLHELATTNNVKRLGHKNEGGSYNYYVFSIDADFVPTLGMKLVAGSNFESGSPNIDKVIINEEAVRRLGFANAEEAIGSRLDYYTRWKGEPAVIAGVLKNFYQRSPKEEHIPMLFSYTDWPSYFAIRLKGQDVTQAVADVKQVWADVYPNSIFHYFFLDDNYNQQYRADAQFGSVIGTFSALAVFIACLGLFGLSSFTIVQRTKEIGIRKVLGASVLQIVRLLSRDFAKVVLISAVIAMPLAYFAMDAWLANYAVRITLNAWIFLFPVAIILLLALTTVSFQTVKSALANPAKALKQE
ncbi:ABC transporter permease [Chryseolinea lacunae]|uniref:ABC transporter permease n=1 Tax=Chryseolinea lacunae TaxID=2801331 RepID=A0ABS1KV49_9BACT|nr:ABC transporter permease [Chryseolinea lacunae]MBL0743097.1 ABC transporter permease [Chryseolinea lacunae]